MGYHVFSYYTRISYSHSIKDHTVYFAFDSTSAVIKIDYIAVNYFTPQNNLLQQKQMKSGFKVVA